MMCIVLVVLVESADGNAAVLEVKHLLPSMLVDQLEQVLARRAEFCQCWCCVRCEVDKDVQPDICR